MNARHLLFLVLLFIPTLAAQDKPKLLILTEKKLGFQEGKNRYTLGEKIADFEKRFGPPEKEFSAKARDGRSLLYFDYVNDGLTVITDSGAEVLAMLFSVNENELRTDKGIGKGSSVREIYRLYGEPTQKQEVQSLELLSLLYQKEDLSFVTFEFEKGKLKTIKLFVPSVM